MITKKEMQEAMEYIAGSCMISTEMALETFLLRATTQEEDDQFNKFLEENECFECEVCGWWSHPGEDSGPICSDCTEDA